MRKLLHWLDNNCLFLLAGFLLIFIPLYPKLPLFDLLPGYIVRVRLEDFFVSFTILIWIVWLLRKKIPFRGNPFYKPIIAYVIVGFLSMVSAVFLIQTVPLQSIHINKMVLHFLRRIEYFSLFFIFFSSVKNLRTVKIYLVIFLITVTSVSLYGFGQKYLYWPAFSTMNREFSKGWMLYLTQHARVLSTFGGHYDLAAFIMMALVLLWSLFVYLRRWYGKLIIFLIIAVAFWTLILTASRTSFIAYIAGITCMFFFWIYKKGIRWSLLRWFAVVMMSLIIMFSFGDLSERFTKILRINERVSGIKSLLFSPIGHPPSERALFLENNPQVALSQITSKSDQPPSINRPSDVYQDIPLYIPSGTGSATLSAVARTYSKTAFIYDLSTAIRLDALWPMAIKGFLRNPILGSGYSTLNKTQVTQFTEAESTDNDYLRSLGETGILGFIAFFGTLFLLLYFIWRNISIIHDPMLFSIAAGFAGLLFGLLVNAGYIDVFESSKVAFSFWAFAGFVVGGISILKSDRTVVPRPTIPGMQEFKISMSKQIRKFIRSDIFILLVIISLAFALRIYKISTPLADWHSWRQADTSAVTRNYVKHGINILYPTYDDLSNVASGKDNPRGLRFVEFPLYNIASVIVDKLFVGYTVEISGRLTSIFVTLGSIIFLFLIVRKHLGRKEAILSSIFYTVLPYNIFFTRVILPEPFFVFSSLGMIYFFDKWIGRVVNPMLLQETKQSTFRERIITLCIFLLSLIFTMSSLLVKPYAVFLFFPMVYLWIKAFGISWKSIAGILVYFLVTLAPFVLWRVWINRYPEGIPAYTWLLNGDGIRFKGAFFYWLFADRLSRLILGYWGLPLLLIGIIAPIRRDRWLFYWWGIGIIFYIIVFATGNVRHDYYQIFTIPIIVIFMSKGITFITDIVKKYSSNTKTYLLLIIILLFMEMFGWYTIRDYYNINHPEIIEAGRSVELKTPEQALVIAPYNGDTAFLYQTHRAGWPILQDPVDTMIKKGAHYYVSVSYDDETKKLMKEALNPDVNKRRFTIIEQTDKFILIQLVPDSQLPK